MGPLGWQETLFIFVLAMLVFGPRKLPELGKTIGKAMSEFRRASSELKATWDREMQAVNRETESLNAAARDYQHEISSSSDGSYDSSYDYSNYSGSDYYGDSHASSSSTESSSDTSTTVSAPATSGAENPAEAGAGDAVAAAPAAPDGESAPAGLESQTVAAQSDSGSGSANGMGAARA